MDPGCACGCVLAVAEANLLFKNICRLVPIHFHSPLFFPHLPLSPPPLVHQIGYMVFHYCMITVFVSLRSRHFRVGLLQCEIQSMHIINSSEFGFTSFFSLPLLFSALTSVHSSVLFYYYWIHRRDYVRQARIIMCVRVCVPIEHRAKYRRGHKQMSDKAHVAAQHQQRIKMKKKMKMNEWRRENVCTVQENYN